MSRTFVQSYTLGDCTVDIYSDGIETVFHTLPGQPSVPANPQDNEAYRATAEFLGYGSDILRMCIDHELSHTLLAVSRGLRWSPTLHGLATGQTFSEWRTEENAVLGFQRLCRLSDTSILNLPPLLAEGH